MIDVYSIGTTLKLNDFVSPELMNLVREFTKLDALAVGVNKQLKAMGSEVAGIRALTAASKQLDTGLKGVNAEALMIEKNLRAATLALPAGGLGIEKELVAANVQAAALARQLAAIHALGHTPGGGNPLLPPVPGGGGGGGGRHRGGLHGGNLHFGHNGVGVGGVGMGLASDMLLPLAAGAVAVYVGHKFYESAKELEKAKADFSNMNLSQSDNDTVLRKSWDLTNSVHGTTAAGNMGLIQDLHTATGDLHHSLEMSDAYAKFSIAASLQNNGQNVDGLVSDSIKALEHRGDKVLQDEKERDKELRMQSQVDFFTRGKVGPADYFSMSKTGKLAYQLASPEYLYGPAAALISANSGATAGTMEMTALSSLIGGHMDKKGKGFLAGLGLWSDVVNPDVAALRKKFDKDPEYQKIVAANGGSLIQSGGLSQENAKLFVEDRNKFVLDVLVPAIKNKYGLNTSDEDIARLLSANLNRNTSNDLSFWVTNEKKVAKDTIGIRRGKDYEGAYDNYMNHTPTGAEKDFEGAWENFKTQFGENMLPAITSMLVTGATILRTIGEFAKTPVATASVDFTGSVLHAASWPYRAIGSLFHGSDSTPEKGGTHAEASVAPHSMGGGSPEFNLFLTDSGKRAIATSTTGFMADHLGRQSTGLIDNGVSLPMPGLK